MMPQLRFAPLAWQLRRVRDQSLIVEQLRVADSFLSRLVGLQFQPPLRPMVGVLITPCSSIHTCFMRFPLDVVGLDSQGVVKAVALSVQPWRIRAMPTGTSAVLELLGGTSTLVPGDRLELIGEPIPTRKSLRFLQMRHE